MNIIRLIKVMLLWILVLISFLLPQVEPHSDQMQTYLSAKLDP